MRNKIIIPIIFFTLCNMVNAHSGGFGLGIIIGEPTGISLKAWQSGKTAIDGAAAWSLGDKGSFHLHANFLFHNYELIKIAKGSLPFYYGIGGRFRKGGNDSANIGVRVPLGLNYIFATHPFDAFFEIVPTLDLFPDTDFDIDVAIGFRYFFR